MSNTRNLIHIYQDGNQWCAIYPIGSNLMDCLCVAFSPVNIVYSESIRRSRDYGRFQAKQNLINENPDLPTHTHYCEHWD